jgi:hypothetical protein
LAVQFTGDEIVLAIIALVRAIDPRMLKSDADGFTVDFTPLEGKKDLSSDEHLLVKLRNCWQLVFSGSKLQGNGRRMF